MQSHIKPFARLFYVLRAHTLTAPNGSDTIISGIQLLKKNNNRPKHLFQGKDVLCALCFINDRAQATARPARLYAGRTVANI